MKAILSQLWLCLEKLIVHAGDSQNTVLPGTAEPGVYEYSQEQYPIHYRKGDHSKSNTSGRKIESKTKTLKNV
jgi:hypothetical protein